MAKVIKSTKQQLWKEKLKELDKIVDNEGVPIDENIKETVAALNLNGFPTIKSCGGHIWNDRLRFLLVSITQHIRLLSMLCRDIPREWLRNLRTRILG